MFFLTPRYVKQGRQFAKDARKLLAYKRDRLSDATVADLEKGIEKLEKAVKARDEREVREAAEQLDALFGAHTPRAEDGWLRENVEVFVVAIAVALGVRTFFLQPFTIPTGSMQPTLNGIVGVASMAPPPNFVTRVFESITLGRAYIHKVAKTDEEIVKTREFKSLLPFIERTPLIEFGFFPRTELTTDKGNRYVIKESLEAVKRDFLGPKELKAYENRERDVIYRAGEPIVAGYFDSGDMVFVDKMTYHFRKPKRGEVFVFNTQRLNTPGNVRQGTEGPSQFYIKRLAGLPGDTLQIRPPQLLVKGERVPGRAFERVMSGTLQTPNDGYKGYANHSLQPGGRLYPMRYLGSPEATVTLEPGEYYALGDNSYHSSDSRDWGAVPQQNLMGRGILVYWPFTRHWGVIN